MISPRTTWRLKTYFLCFIMVLVSFSVFAGVEMLKSSHAQWAKTATFKPFYRAFTMPDMKRYNEFCKNPSYKRLEYLDIKRALANQDDIKSAYQYGAIAVYAPCSQINKVVGKTYLKKAADAGSADAYYLLGLSNPSKYNILMRYAANIGHPKAAYNLAISSMSERHNIDINPDKYYLYAIEGNIVRAKHDYALFLLNNMQHFQESKLHYAHNLLKEAMVENQDTLLAGYAAYNIFLLQQRYPQIIYQKNEVKNLLEVAKRFGLAPKVLSKKTISKKKSSQKVASVKVKKEKEMPLNTREKIILWENQEVMNFGNRLY